MMMMRKKEEKWDWNDVKKERGIVRQNEKGLRMGPRERSVVGGGGEVVRLRLLRLNWELGFVEIKGFVRQKWKGLEMGSGERRRDGCGEVVRVR